MYLKMYSLIHAELFKTFAEILFFRIRFPVPFQKCNWMRSQVANACNRHASFICRGQKQIGILLKVLISHTITFSFIHKNKNVDYQAFSEISTHVADLLVRSIHRHNIYFNICICPCCRQKRKSTPSISRQCFTHHFIRNC